ncbi:MAG: putative zinc protease AlbF [Firmicutes bacterium ADurb.Bin193]|nr:MAG: putative zinc protease AlbF [Firmicutes bacterium ADurb.Bin193]
MVFEKTESRLLGETLYMGKHESGLMIYVLPKPDHSKSYASFAAKVGSIDNKFLPADDTEPFAIPDGVAHFLEHKLFEQPDGTNAFDSYSKTGASANAYTSFNMTAYLFSCTDRFYENLEILLDFVGKPYFTDENVLKEQGIIGQEIRMYDDDPNWRVFFNLLCALYSEHSVRNDIAGTVESISQINKDILYKCYKTFYNPSNMVLFTCGRVDCESVAALVDKYVTANPIGEIKRFYPIEPAGVNKPLIEQNLSVACPMFQLGFKDSEVGITGDELLKKQITTEILLEMLVGHSSTLYNSLYEKGLINDTFAYECSCEEGYSYSAMGGESSDPEKVRDEIVEEIKTTDLNDEEFTRCRKVMIGKFLRLFNSVEKISNAFVASVFKGVDLLRYVEICEGITLDDVKKRRDGYLKPENCAMSVIKPY